eukprot:2785404-Amphidinium_carterae.3
MLQITLFAHCPTSVKRGDKTSVNAENIVSLRFAQCTMPHTLSCQGGVSNTMRLMCVQFALCALRTPCTMATPLHNNVWLKVPQSGKGTVRPH